MYSNIEEYSLTVDLHVNWLACFTIRNCSDLMEHDKRNSDRKIYEENIEEYLHLSTVYYSCDRIFEATEEYFSNFFLDVSQVHREPMGF